MLNKGLIYGYFRNNKSDYDWNCTWNYRAPIFWDWQDDVEWTGIYC